jgi:hypothetical protein
VPHRIFALITTGAALGGYLLGQSDSLIPSSGTVSGASVTLALFGELDGGQPTSRAAVDADLFGRGRLLPGSVRHADAAGGRDVVSNLHAGDGGGGVSTTYRGEYFYDYGWRYGAYCRHDLYLGLHLSRTVSHG